MLNQNQSITGCDNEWSNEQSTALEHLTKLVEGLDIAPCENYLKRYLYGTNFNVDEAFKKIKLTQEHINEHPDWYRKNHSIKLKNVIDSEIRVVLSDCDKEGRPIFLMKNGNIDPSIMDMFDVISVDDLWIEYILMKHPETAAKGLCVVMDIKDQSWKLMKWMQPSNMKNSLKKVDNLPFRNFKIHIVNNSWWISIGIKTLWPFMPQKFKEMIKFHFNDMESLYEYIDKKVIPVEYGGLKEVKYAEIFEDLYNRNDEILNSYSTYRSTK